MKAVYGDRKRLMQGQMVMAGGLDKFEHVFLSYSCSMRPCVAMEDNDIVLFIDL